MAYVLGVDVGTAFTTAARCDDADFGAGCGAVSEDRDRPDGAVVLPLTPATRWVHSVLYLADDDTVLVGRDALARAETEPDRVARGFLNRIGDPIAPLIGGRPCPAETLTAVLVRWVVDRAVEIERAEPDRVVLTHPAGWGPHRRGLLDAALRQAGLTDVLLLAGPLAAAECHLAANPMVAGDTLAVYDLGARTLRCAVARLGRAGFDLCGHAETGEQTGGDLFDDLLTGHVLGELGRAAADLDPFDEDLRAAMAQLREGCRTAKEALSASVEAIVATSPLGPRSSVLVTRAVLAELISPALSRTVDVLRQTVLAAAVPAERLSAVALSGGSALIPLLTDLVTAAFPARVVLDPDPETALARGAALAGQRARAAGSAAEPGSGPMSGMAGRTAGPATEPEHPGRPEPIDPDAPTQPPRPPVQMAPLDLPVRGARRWKTVGRSRRRTG
ncbi:MAG: Hsp70 family protein [Labedaea sp.]